MTYAVTERERARRKSIKLSTPIRHGVIRTRVVPEPRRLSTQL